MFFCKTKLKELQGELDELQRELSFSKKGHYEKSWQHQEDDFCMQQESL
ncbi:hypothetical protein [Bacillus cereus]|nr:hypothetical protein [Bacillus cereus]